MATNYLYGTGNYITSSGSYYLEPLVLGLGPASVEFSSTDSSQVTASVQLLGLLNTTIAAAATYTITADANTVVTVSADSVSLLTEMVLNAAGGTVALAGGLLSALSDVTVNLTDGGTFSGTGLISAATGLIINFGNGGGVLNLAGSSTGLALLSGSTINGFGAGDSIIIATDSGLATITDVSYNSILGSTTLTFSNGDTLILSGEYTNDPAGSGTYLTTETESGGSGTVLVVACYCRGTRIATACGEMAVEDLRIGDLVMTASGQQRPVHWIGQRSYSARFAATSLNVQPVLFRQGSLGNGLPCRDLYVSPEHAMYLDGVLIPAHLLVNGVSILQTVADQNIEYFHIELETHDILLAEGAPSESFVDDNSREMFHNAAEYYRLHAKQTKPAIARYCAPRVESGDVLEAIRRRLAREAISSMTVAA